MSLKIEETFRIRAPVDRVWRYLTDPTRVVVCLPGAELTAVQDASTYLGKVKVKVGPITAAYAGTVTMTERDQAAGIVRMTGEGKESAGAGSARMTMTSTLVALPDGGTEVRVSADVEIVGKIVQFGRGMIESVNKQLFRQFTECVRATLERETDEPARGDAADASQPRPSLEMLPPTLDDLRAPAPDGPVTGSMVKGGRAPVAGPLTVGVYLPPPGMSAGARAADAPTSTTPPAPHVATPVRVLPLVGRALWDGVMRLLRWLGTAFRR